MLSTATLVAALTKTRSSPSIARSTAFIGIWLFPVAAGPQIRESLCANAPSAALTCSSFKDSFHGGMGGKLMQGSSLSARAIGHT